MFKIVPLTQEYLDQIDPSLSVNDLGHTQPHVILKDGKPMVCGGISRCWEGRGIVWSVFNPESKGCFVGVFKVMRAWLDKQLRENYFRIELAVEDNFEKFGRRAELLGFKLEIPLAKKYLPDGSDCPVYSMVRED